MKVEQFQNKSMNEDFVQLFSTGQVTDIYLNYSQGIFRDREWMWTARIEYRKGDLSGEKRFKDPNIDGIMSKIKNFLEANS